MDTILRRTSRTVSFFPLLTRERYATEEGRADFMDSKGAWKDGGLGIVGGRGRVSVLFLFLICASLAVAQLDTGTISGTVTDQSGAAAPGATLTIRNVETGVSRKVETNPGGRYEATALPVGHYEVNASLSGFQTTVRKGIELTVGRHAVVDLALQVGEVSQSITISGEASFVETTTATVSNLVNEKRVLEIPLNNRDLTQLSYFQPGVLRIPRGGTRSRSEISGLGDRLSVAGARATQNVYLLDGMSNSDLSGNAQSASGAYTGAETIKEFQIITNNYSAEYPSKPGAIVSAVTKSGTNSFHGSIYEFLRNDNLDAAKWEDNAFGQRKPEFKRNHFGGSLGGPIVRDRTFFFTSYEGMRERVTKTGTATVPSLEGRRGILGNRTVLVSDVVRPFLDTFPLPGQGNVVIQDFRDGRALIASPEREPTNENFGAVKIDHQFASEKKGFLSVTYNVDEAERAVFTVLPGEDSVTTASTKHVISARHTSILSPALLNEFAVGITRATPKRGLAVPEGIDLSKLAFAPDRTLMGGVYVSDLTNIGYPREGSSWGQNLLTFKESVSLTHQGHTMKMGMELNRIQNPVRTTSGSYNGTYSFDSLELFLQNRPRLFEIDLPKGTPVQGTVARAVRKFDLRQFLFGFYLQDNYQVRPSFTLNLGLRYEFMTLPTEAEGNLAALRNFTDPTTVVGPVFTNPTLKSFSPRLGFAWSPGSRKTSLRGGFGIYYDHPTLYHWQTNVQEMVPLNVAGAVEDLASTGLIRFPVAATTQTNLLRATPNIRTPEYNQKPTYVYRWSLTLERELGTWFVSASYTGARARHLWLQGDANVNRWIGWPENPTGPKRFPATGGVAINPAFNNIWVQSPNGNSYYHGLALNVQKRLTAGLQVQAAYTFSKSIDQGSGNTSAADQLPQSQRSIYYWDMQFRRGPSILDIRNNFVTNFTYEFPKTALAGWGGTALNGWQMNGILGASSGHPFSASDGTRAQSQAMRRAGGLRPNLIPGGNNNPVLGEPGGYFDSSQFIPSTCLGGRFCRAGDPDYQVGYFGNLGQNTLVGPGLVTFDFSLTKNFQFTEEKRLQFRAEFFNLLNRANFAIPASRAFLSNGNADPEAGRITQTRTSAREIQFGLKFTF